MIGSDVSYWLLEPTVLDGNNPVADRMLLDQFCAHIWAFYKDQGRSFPWRDTCDPYRILLSELMLQQTQTERVLPKYAEFLSIWPDFSSIARSPLLEILSRWKGLGYNRRALALRNIAMKSEAYGWTLPDDYATLLEFPMIGPATASAILSFCYGKPSIYLETNIRRVMIHQFFPGEESVGDAAIKMVLGQLVDMQSDFKHWYYALMDYGVFLKRMIPNPNRYSAHYKRQGKFEDSNRQIRGMLLLLFTERGVLNRSQLYGSLPFEGERIEECLQALMREGFIADMTAWRKTLPNTVVGEDQPWYGIVRPEDTDAH
ncbi:MAG: DNA repair protein [Sphaerochaetaceae bacterium]